MSLNGSQANFARCLAISWAGTLYIHFWGCCTRTEFCHVQNSLYVQVSSSPIFAALLHGTPSAGASQYLRRGTRNGITELSQKRRHLYSAGRPSRWASAHILVTSLFMSKGQISFRYLVADRSETGRRPASSCLDGRPNSSSLLVCDQLRTSLRPDGVTEFGYKTTRTTNYVDFDLAEAEYFNAFDLHDEVSARRHA